MKLDAITMKERTLYNVWEKLKEAVGMLEEAFPDWAEELGWICENLGNEWRRLKQKGSSSFSLEEEM